jgi:hypothetical protein
VLYYADNAVLTVRCNAQNYLKRHQGAEEYALQSSLLFVVFFWVFSFESNQHSIGVGCWDDMEDESDEK